MELDSGTRLEFLKELHKFEILIHSVQLNLWDRCMKLRSGLISRLQYFLMELLGQKELIIDNGEIFNIALKRSDPRPKIAERFF